MSDVIGFTDFVEKRVLSAHQASAAWKNQQQNDFTLRDREDLEDWSSAEQRVSICHSDMGPFAMLYERERPWASWGVVRQGRSVLLWDCITLADIGRYPSMIDALAAVAIGDFPTPVANVLHFAAARVRTSPAGQ